MTTEILDAPNIHLLKWSSLNWQFMMIYGGVCNKKFLFLANICKIMPDEKFVSLVWQFLLDTKISFSNDMEFILCLYCIKVDVEEVMYVAKELWRGRSARDQSSKDVGRGMWRSVNELLLVRCMLSSTYWPLTIYHLNFIAKKINTFLLWFFL